MSGRVQHPTTPDGHYFVVRGRLWRCTNPGLTPEEKAHHTQLLMQARRNLRQSHTDPKQRQAARDQVQKAKEALGERGPVWWHQGPVCDRCMVKNTVYRLWYEKVVGEASKSPQK